MNKLYIFCGIPFAGKTEIAKKVAHRFGYERIDLDEVKFELLGKNRQDESITQSEWDQVYQDMYKRIETALHEGKTVIHDTGNFTLSERNIVRKIGEQNSVEVITVFIDTSIEIARQRLIENRKNPTRFDVSDKDFESTVAEMEPPTSNEKHVAYNETVPIDEWMKENLT